MAGVSYILSDDVVVYDNARDEIRIRKGVWDYEEACILLADQSDDVKALVFKLMNTLDAGEEVDFVNALATSALRQEDKESILSLVHGLAEQRYIVPKDSEPNVQLLYDLMNGYLPTQVLDKSMHMKPILFFSDSEEIRNYAQNMCHQISLPVHVMSDQEYDRIIHSDILDCSDGLRAEASLRELQAIFEPYCCVVGGCGKLNVIFMRIINRVLISLNLPLSMAFIDGPFTSVFTICPPETGCFECMEQRILARMEEHPVYRKYVEETRYKSFNAKQLSYIPLLWSITSIAIFEGFTISAIGKSKFAGRAMNTYIPVMEVQVEDILRVPYCPACGMSAKAEMREMYSSSSAIVNKMLKSIEIV